MKQLVYSRQQVDLDATPFLLPEVIRSCTLCASLLILSARRQRTRSRPLALRFNPRAGHTEPQKRVLPEGLPALSVLRLRRRARSLRPRFFAVFRRAGRALPRLRAVLPHRRALAARHSRAQLAFLRVSERRPRREPRVRLPPPAGLFPGVLRAELHPAVPSAAVPLDSAALPHVDHPLLVQLRLQVPLHRGADAARARRHRRAVLRSILALDGLFARGFVSPTSRVHVRRCAGGAAAQVLRAAVFADSRGAAVDESVRIAAVHPVFEPCGAESSVYFIE